MPDNTPCPDCDTVVLSDRTYRAILSETASFGDRETGGLLLGNFHNRFWYIMEGIDPGFRTVNRTTDFEYQVEYVNHLSKKIGVLYKHPLTIVGLWHRHPGDMDTFSATDYKSMQAMVSDASVGLIFMLVNVDPEFRMTFYYLNRDLELYRVPYVVGDAYIPQEIKELADPATLSRNGEGSVPIRSVPMPPPHTFPQTLAELDARSNRLSAPIHSPE